MQTSHIVHHQSTQPKHMNVIIQGAAQVVYHTFTSFELKTANVTFAVLGTFDQTTATSDQKFMDSLVVQAFDRATYRDVFLALLKESPNEPLSQVVEFSLQKHGTALSGGGINMSTVAPSKTASSEGLTPVDLSLIVASSLILVVVVLVLLHGRARRLKTSTGQPPKRSEASPVSPSRKFATTTSFDESFSGSYPIPKAEPVSLFNPKQALTPNFRIIKHSPPKAFEKSMSNATTVMMSNRSPSPENVTVAMTTPSPSALEMTSDSEDSEDGFSRSGDLLQVLESTAERFSSKWFEGSQTSFSVDSHDIFGVDVSSKADDDQCFASTNSASYKGQSMEEWVQSIRVVARPGSTKSLAGLRLAPQSLTNFETTSNREESEGGFTI